MHVKRLLLAGLVALGLAPGLFVRAQIPPKDFASPVSIRALDAAPLRSGPLVLEGAWVLASANDHFGGYSALIEWDADTFLAASDAGRLMFLPRPDRSGAAPRLGQFGDSAWLDKIHTDIESMTRDPASGAVWLGLEAGNAIRRLDSGLRERAEVQPDAMRDWRPNSGPESLVRLPDGRFLTIEEYPQADGRHTALLFLRDPTLGGTPTSFTFEGRDGFRPSDATLTPDGRLLVLLRGIGLGRPLHFPAMLVLADLALIAPGKLLRSRTLAHIDTPMPSDNYEGVAVTAEEDGGHAVWLISDDNFTRYQRTLLLKLRWEDAAPRTPQTNQGARR